MHDVLEISKGIYFELKAKWLTKDSEAFQTGKNVVRTLFKGATSFFNIDISSSDDELRQLYESVDLSNKLIILEDAERSAINIIELLAYVNSLVEQDDVKVLIVSNESALIEYVWSEPDKDGTRKKIFTKASLEYLQTKEKTVGDTILFQPNYAESLRSIILSFENEHLSGFATEEYINEIIIIFGILKCGNLRTFIFACQKTIDIYERIKDTLPKERLECIFYSLIAFFNTHQKQECFQTGREQRIYRLACLSGMYHYIAFAMIILGGRSLMFQGCKRPLMSTKQRIYTITTATEMIRIFS